MGCALGANSGLCRRLEHVFWAVKVGLVSGRVQKVTKAGFLVQEVLGQQRGLSGGCGTHVFAAANCDNWTPRPKFLGAICRYRPCAGGWQPGNWFPECVGEPK